jgi:uncharacterized protein YaeQ
MALKATIYKADLQVVDVDRHHYADYALTIARHPSETDERLMVRLLAFALYARDGLDFGRGLSTDDDADLWQRDLTGAIDLWIDVGQPDERAIRKACGRAREVVVLSYGGLTADPWWGRVHSALARCDNLVVRHVPGAASLALAALAQRSLSLQCTIHDGAVTMADETRHVEVPLLALWPER